MQGKEQNNPARRLESDLIGRLDSIERLVVRIAYTIGLIVTVITLLTVEFQQVGQVLKMIIGK